MARNPLRMTANGNHTPDVFANREFLSIMSERVAVRDELGGYVDERAGTNKNDCAGSVASFSLKS